MMVLKNGHIWNGEDFLYGGVVIEDDVIAQIGTVFDAANGYVFDASDAVICPGMVDIHTHIRNVSCDEFGVQGESACFPFGVTAVADVSCITDNKKLLESFMLKNVVFACTSIKNNKVDFTQAEHILKYINPVGIKIFFDKGVSPVKDIAPLKVLCDYAHSKDLKVMVHCTNPPVSMGELLECLDKGDICTHAYHGIGHTVAEDDFSSLRKAKARGVIIDTGMAGGVHMDFSIVKKALESGILPDTISTDTTRCSAFVRGGRYGMTLAMSIMRTLGMQENHILKAVTSSPAKALNKENSWGTLKVGANADIAVLKYGNYGFDITDKTGNRLNSDQGYSCLITIVDGQIVYRSENI